MIPNSNHNALKFYLLGSLSFGFFLCIATMSESAFSQQVYKWVDSNGKVQYGEKRNAPTTSQAVNIKPVPSTGTPSVSRATADRTARDPSEILREHENLMRKLTRVPEGIPDRYTAPKSEKWPKYKISMPAKSGQNENILALGESVLQSCVSIAVKLYELDYGPEKTAMHDQYLKTCPGVKVECVEYRKSPEKNICEPKSMGTEQKITVFRSQS